MVLKKTFPAFETIFVGADSSVPKELLAEAKEFMERNGLVAVASNLKDKKPVYKCCERCLKAYLLKKFTENTWNIGALKSVLLMLKCEAGHNGYYLDSDEVKEV